MCYSWTADPGSNSSRLGRLIQPMQELQLPNQRERLPAERRIEVEESIERLSWLLDDFIRIPGIGWRFGLDAVVGLIPGVGDMLTSAASFYILAAGVRYRVPKITLFRMGMNLGLDYVLGSLPLVGDLFDAWWKSNQRNVALLTERATVSAEQARAGRISDWMFVGVIILTLIAITLGAAAISVYLITSLLSQAWQIAG